MTFFFAFFLALPGFSVRLVNVSPTLVELWHELPVTYHLQLAGSDDLAPEVATAAVRKAFASWADLECSTVAFLEVGDAPDPTTNMGAGGRPNGKNEVHWVENDRWRFGAYVLGVTAPIISADGRLVEADIAFNGLQVQWSASGNGGTDLESVAAHEIGHFIGIQHNLGPYAHGDPPTMAPYISWGTRSGSLTEDDIRAACFLYPTTPYVCASDDDCPQLLSQTFESDDFYSGRLRCDDGACTLLERYVQGGVGFGERCHRPEECRDGLLCHPFADAGVCTHGCDPYAAESGCDDGYACEHLAAPLDQSGFCVPREAAVADPGQGVEGCRDAWICTGGQLCMPTPLDPAHKRCATLCVVAAPDCPEGTRCHSYGGAGGACFPPEWFPAEPEPEPGPESEAEPEPEPAPELDDDLSPDKLESDGADTASEPDRAPERRPADTGCSGDATPTWPLIVIALRALTLRRRKAGRAACYPSFRG